MNVSDYSNKVRDQLVAAAALGNERTQQIAQTLAHTVDAAVRLAVIDAISRATSDITAALFEADLSQGSQPTPAVSLQLDGDELRIVVAHPPVDDVAAQRVDEGEATARISLRLTETLKGDIERAAESADVSVNSWLVRAASQALRGGAGWGSDWPSHGGPGGRPANRKRGRTTG